MTVRVDKVQLGDLVPPGRHTADGARRPVTEIRRYGVGLKCIPSLYLVIPSGDCRLAVMYLGTELVTIERHIS